MTTATLARGPPMTLDEDAMMDDDDIGENSPGRARSNHRDIEDNAEGRNALMIDDADVNSDDEGDGAVDYSGNHTGKTTGSSDGDGEADGDQDTFNGSVESYDGYRLMGDRNGRNGSAGGSAHHRAGGSRGHSASQASPNGIIGTGKNGKSFICDICMKTFSNAANMRRHRVRHSGIKPFECRFCQKRFFRKDHMREHMNHKHNNTQVQMECYFCQQVFDKEKDLFQHVTRDHEVNPRELHCQYCSFSATTIGRFLWHMTTSHPRKNSHYSDSASAEGLSMAPYPLDNDYEAAESTSPTLHIPATSSRSGSKRQREPERDFESYTKPDSPSEHSSNRLNGGINRYYGGGLEESSPALSASRKKYVSILPSYLQNDGVKSEGVEDLSGLNNHLHSHHDAPEDLSHFAAAAAIFGKTANGNPTPTTAQLVAQAKAEAAMRSSYPTHPVTGSSNRRKSKAPVRMTAEAEENETNGNGIVKREYPSNGNGEHYTSMLEEVMSHQNPQRSANNQPEDLSLANLLPFVKRPKLSSSPAASAPSQPQNNSQSTDAVSRDAQEGSESSQKCPYCLIIYPDNVMYLLHKMLHTREHPYRCAVCQNQYPNRYEFYAHVVNHRP